jgi:glycosyltransferase involved in cell wall biosynthesis
MSRTPRLHPTPLNVAVICPVAGAAPFLDETIGSVLAQSLSDWRLILIANGSDRNLQVFTELDPRIEVIAEPRLGVAAARNQGLRRVTEATVAFLDADDIWHPEKLAVQCEFLRRSPGHGAVYNAFDLIDEMGRRIGSGWAPSSITFRGLCRAEDIIPGSNLMFRSSLLASCGWMNEQLRFGSDVDWLFKLAKQAPLGFVDQVLTNYRLHPNNMTKDYWAAYRDVTALLCEYAGDRHGRRRAEARADRRAGVRHVRRTYSGQALDAWRASQHRTSWTALRHFRRSVRLDWRWVAHEGGRKAQAWANSLLRRASG